MKKTFEKDLIWLCIPVGILLGLILKLFIIDFLHISGHSMEPTLASGDSVLVFRLAYGIPVGGDIEYADEVTLLRAIENRTEL